MAFAILLMVSVPLAELMTWQLVILQFRAMKLATSFTERVYGAMRPPRW
jgi:hypothetical protein